MRIVLITATRMSEAEFWINSALGQSLERIKFPKENVSASFLNEQGLPVIYNKFLSSAGDDDLAVFVHDDVWIEDIFFEARIADGLRLFDVFGVIGNKGCAPMQPSWAYPDRSLTWDSPDNLMGAIAHGDFPFGSILKFREIQGTCALVDGVLIAAHCGKLKQCQIGFDERFRFHFYDVDFCRTVVTAGLRLGVYPVGLTHQSGGSFEDPEWGKQYIEYVRKWCPEARADVVCSVTPPHDSYNPDLLELMAGHASRVVEVGCSRGALARAYRAAYECDEYIGIELDAESAKAAGRYCSRVIVADVEAIDHSDWDALFPSALWVFGDSLEHLRDPWSLLRRLRACIDHDSRVVACLPNSQHWSLQARLATGDLFYEDEGLLDRTHLRWFTRKTIVDLFESAGFAVESIKGRIFDEPNRDAFFPLISQFAQLAGRDSTTAVNDSVPLQYVVLARPF